MLIRLFGPRRDRDEQGLVAVMTALTAVILLIIAGMVVDLGLARDTRRQAQAAADASALAGGNVLYPASGHCSVAALIPPCFDDAVTAVKSYAAANYNVSAAAWTSCTDTGHYYYVPSTTPCISFADASLGTTQPAQPTKVRVVIPTRSVRTAFGSLAGVNSVPIKATARAALTPGAARSCGLCILGTGVSDLGNGDVTVNGGSVHSNGTIDSGPNGTMGATPSTMSITTSGTCPGHCNPAAQTGVPQIADPLANNTNLPPTVTGTAQTTPCTQGPGIYGALTLPNSTCTLTPGLYVLTGIWQLQNNTMLQGTGVTIYATCGTTAAPTVCTSGQAGGGLDVKNGNTQLTAPTAPSANAGYVIVYDRENTAPLNMQGNGNSNVTGTVYAPKSLLQFPGNSCVTVTNGPVIVGQLYGNGNTGCIDLTNVNGANIPVPPDGVSLDQ